MRQHSNLSNYRRQSGSTLIVSLIILILVMLVGVTAMTASKTQYRLAGNLQFEESAMNSTETAINAAEYWLSTGTNWKNPGFTAYNSTAAPQIYPISALTSDPLTMTWDDTNSIQVASNVNQRYLIEQMSANNRLTGSSQTVGGRSSSGCNQVNTYRITARGASARGALKFVQSYYSVLSC